MASEAIPSYASPPLTEVAFGIQFTPVALQTAHVGKFWTEVGTDFPLTQDAPPLPDVAETPSVSLLTMPPLRRSLLVSKDTEYLLQIQDSKFFHNWRRSSGDSKYPRFKTLFPSFVAYWKRFSEFLAQQRLGTPVPVRYELTYVNALENVGNMKVEESVKLVNWDSFNTGFLHSPETANTAWVFALPDAKGKITVGTNRAIRDKGQSAVVLSLSCSGEAKDKQYSIEQWFDTAHEYIVRGFTDLTTEPAQKVWGRER